MLPQGGTDAHIEENVFYEFTIGNTTGYFLNNQQTTAFTRWLAAYLQG
jgi:hypothetical protein